MKKYFLILTAIATTSVAFAQKSKVVSAFNYNKAFTNAANAANSVVKPGK